MTWDNDMIDNHSTALSLCPGDCHRLAFVWAGHGTLPTAKGGVPVWSVPATAYQGQYAESNLPVLEGPEALPGYRVIRVGEDGAVSTEVLRVAPPPESLVPPKL